MEPVTSGHMLELGASCSLKGSKTAGGSRGLGRPLLQTVGGSGGLGRPLLPTACQVFGVLARGANSHRKGGSRRPRKVGLRRVPDCQAGPGPAQKGGGPGICQRGDPLKKPK